MASLVRCRGAWRHECDPRAAFRYSIHFDKRGEFRSWRRPASRIPDFRPVEVRQAKGTVVPRLGERRLVLFRVPRGEGRESFAAGVPCMVAVTSAIQRARSKLIRPIYRRCLGADSITGAANGTPRRSRWTARVTLFTGRRHQKYLAECLSDLTRSPASFCI